MTKLPRRVALAVLAAVPLLLGAAGGCESRRPVGPTESGTVVRVVPQVDRNRELVEVETPDGRPFTVRLDVGDCAVGDRYPACTTD